MTKEIIVIKTSWCGPCKDYEKQLQLTEAKNGIEILRLDRETKAFESKAEEIPGLRDFMSVPATAITNRGKVLSSFNGFMTAQALQTWLADNNASVL